MPPVPVTPPVAMPPVPVRPPVPFSPPVPVMPPVATTPPVPVRPPVPVLPPVASVPPVPPRPPAAVPPVPPVVGKPPPLPRLIFRPRRLHSPVCAPGYGQGQQTHLQRNPYGNERGGVRHRLHILLQNGQRVSRHGSALEMRTLGRCWPIPSFPTPRVATRSGRPTRAFPDNARPIATNVRWATQ